MLKVYLHINLLYSNDRIFLRCQQNLPCCCLQTPELRFRFLLSERTSGWSWKDRSTFITWNLTCLEMHLFLLKPLVFVLICEKWLTTVLVANGDSAAHSAQSLGSLSFLEVKFWNALYFVREASCAKRGPVTYRICPNLKKKHWVYFIHLDTTFLAGNGDGVAQSWLPSFHGGKFWNTCLTREVVFFP